ncbi:hypothetical protein [Sulfitobacter geojensis]|uniref:Uncharacterized protein n=1 Tax=Sulfitobacter geojensis TaxID=1342299 RepID=A0AAE2W225_9RHOB|nr:hypothetical protein [Sulfitobacter geojensis]MBM1690702.1 hypothetical protein [Sulfitobacter geojensis]MBM1694768.1 hypothetical protein [Sulfitobacter geojensis]MBM1707868.1 hypothetical protein [Sulfitobacter geojensis]MBM1711136.1 hypothetical protein [Sulfitobacter geojensis]MBM1716001.1 hypothetical protein [Sulfitobacter geojensis]
MGIDKISADILTRTTQILRSGSDEDLQRLRKYLAGFKISKTGSSEIGKKPFRDLTYLIKELRDAKSSSEAMDLLNARNLNKDHLIELSKEIGLPVVKSDRLEHLKAKIIHELVETRLNSEAIQNPNSIHRPK